MPTKPKHDRCTRCIKQRKQCDGVKPTCELCAKQRNVECVYPEGMPSRRELLEREAIGVIGGSGNRYSGSSDVEMTDIPESTSDGPNQSVKGGEVQARGRSAKTRQGPTPEQPRQTIFYGESDVPVLRGGGGQVLTSAYPAASGPSTCLATSITTSSKQRDETLVSDKVSANGAEIPLQPTNLSATVAEEEDLTPTPEDIGRNLIRALEQNNAPPLHRGGVLDGLSDWTSHVDEVWDMSGKELKELGIERIFETIGEVLRETQQAKGGGSGVVGESQDRAGGD